MNLARVALAERTLGWLLPADGPYLHELALEAGGPILEMGSYCGKSTVWLGDAAEAAGQQVVSVDWHRGSHDMARQDETLDAAGKVDTLGLLRRTIVESCLESTVMIVCATSQAAARLLGDGFAMVFIDGAHDRDSVAADATLWAPHLRAGGIMAFHDYDRPEVAAVVDHLDGFEPVGMRGIVRAVRKVEG